MSISGETALHHRAIGDRLSHEPRRTEKKKIRFWVMPNAGFATRPILERELQQFTKRHPNIEVKLTVIPWSKAWQRLMVVTKRLTGEEKLPDVIQIGSTWQGTLTYLGGLKELTGLISTSALGDFIDPLLASCFAPSSKKIYAVPWFSDIRVLYYRKDVLHAVQADPSELRDWHSFRRVLARIREKFGNKIAPMTLSGQIEKIQMHDLAPWVWSAGCDFFDYEGHCTLQDDRAVQALDFYFSMINDGLVRLTGRDRMSFGTFFTGSSAFQISGAWPAQSVFNPKSREYHADVAQHFGVAPFPAEAAGSQPRTFAGGSHLAISSHCKDLPEAWSLVRFLTEREHQESYAMQFGVLPARKSSFNDSLFGKAGAEVRPIFEASIDHARTFPPLAVLGSIEQLVGHFSDEVLGLIRSGAYSRDAMAELARRTSEEITTLLTLYA